MKYFKTLTLGCKVNTYETEAIKEILEQNGYQESYDEKCDVFVVNTCAVTKVGEQKSRQKIHDAIRKYPEAIVVSVGCSSQLHSDELKKIPGLDILLGTENRGSIVSLINKYEITHEQIDAVNKDTRHRSYECLNISSYNDNTRAFLKVQDGCNNFCSYCIVPYTRGNFRSRPKEDVIKEVHRLVDNGFKEIVLSGVDTGGYGKDLGNYNLTDLVREIIESEPRLKRLRTSSIEESEVKDEFIELVKNSKVVAHHFHLPLQSGSKTVLERMHRKYTKEQFYNTVKKIKEAIPDAAIACDIIVGFPGETEEEFLETMDFVKQCGFTMLHVFPYSPRPNTPAAKMPNQVPFKIKKERVHRLIDLGNELHDEFAKSFEGKMVDVLFETYDSKTHINHGLTSNYLDVYYQSDESLHNQMLEIPFHFKK